MGITYYSEFKNVIDIINPILDNNVYMKFRGSFEPAWTDETVKFKNFGYGLKRGKFGRGLIYSKDASKLFSMGNGYIGITLELPEDITNGIYSPIKNQNYKYYIFGSNINSNGLVSPGIQACFSSSGIEFTIATSAAIFTITDTSTTVLKNTPFLLEWTWNKSGIDDFSIENQVNLLYRVDEQATIISDVPIADDSIVGSNFCILNTLERNSNFDCIIKRMTIGNSISIDVYDDYHSSSSSSLSSESSSESSASSNTSSSSVE